MQLRHDSDRVHTWQLAVGAFTRNKFSFALYSAPKTGLLVMTFSFHAGKSSAWVTSGWLMPSGQN